MIAFEKLQAYFFKKFYNNFLSELNTAIPHLPSDLIKELPKCGILDDYYKFAIKVFFVLQKGVLAFEGEIEEEELLKEADQFLKEEYKVLLRFEQHLIKTYVNNFSKILSFIEKHQEEFQQTFDIKDYNVKAINFGAGDKHNGGQSVAIIEFKDTKKVVYKPRNLQLDIQLNSLFDFFNGALQADLYTPKYLVFEDCGFMEFIAYLPCKNEHDINAFYYQTGILLFIMYVTNATDFHFENIIANGSKPVLIDLESFFHPIIPAYGDNFVEEWDTSVLKTGLLPCEIITDTESIDISGLTDTAGKSALINELRVTTENNQIKLQRNFGTLEGGSNIPYISDQKYPILFSNEFSKSLEKGFEAAYRLVLSNLTPFQAIIHQFSTWEVRSIVRNTASYAHLLNEASHPSVLKSEDTFRLHLEKINTATSEFSFVKKLIPYEIEALQNFDIPFFTANNNTPYLYCDGKPLEQVKLLKNGFDSALDILERLSERDLRNQLWVVQNSIKLQHNLLHKNEIKNEVYHGDLDLKSLLRAVSKKTLETVKTEISDSGLDYGWLLLKQSHLDERHYSIHFSTYDLFSGMPGEILFFAAYAKVFESQDANDMFQKAYTTFCKSVEKAKTGIRGLGMYTGWGSILQLNTLLYVITKEVRFLAENESHLNTIDFKDLIDQDISYSMLNGSAGFIAACINYFQYSKNQKALEFAQYAATHLINAACPTEIGKAWRFYSKTPLSGISHGASGVMLAFAMLHTVIKDEKYAWHVDEIWNYENSLFDSSQQNWLDKRDFIVQDDTLTNFCSCAWSHGAGGIGLARLALLNMGWNDPKFMNDLKIAQNTVHKHIKYSLNTLCYGDFGNYDFLLEFNRSFGKDATDQKLETYLSASCLDILQNNWKVGKNGIQSLGFFTGITGIGYQVLRFLDPSLPSVLNPSLIP